MISEWSYNILFIPSFIHSPAREHFGSFLSFGSCEYTAVNVSVQVSH